MKTYLTNTKALQNPNLMHSKSIKNLINTFSKLPSIGPRQASRIVFALIKWPEDEVEKFAQSLAELKKNVTFCASCFASFERSDSNVCKICSGPQRLKNTICVLEKDIEMSQIENAGFFNGVYHIVGNIDILNKKIVPTTVQKLIERIEALKNDHKEIEIVLATNPSAEGDATAIYLKQKIDPLGVKITFLGRGLSTGGELEYLDRETITNAFQNRK